MTSFFSVTSILTPYLLIQPPYLTLGLDLHIPTQFPLVYTFCGPLIWFVIVTSIGTGVTVSSQFSRSTDPVGVEEYWPPADYRLSSPPFQTFGDIMLTFKVQGPFLPNHCIPKLALQLEQYLCSLQTSLLSNPCLSLTP